MPRDEDQSDRSICAKEQGKKKTNTNTRATAHWALIRAMLHLVFDKNRKKNFCPWQRLFVSVFTALIFTCVRSAGITPINAFAKKKLERKGKKFLMLTRFDYLQFTTEIFSGWQLSAQKVSCQAKLLVVHVLDLSVVGGWDQEVVVVLAVFGMAAFWSFQTWLERITQSEKNISVRILTFKFKQGIKMQGVYERCASRHRYSGCF